jgi:hypothetical protein
MPNLQIIDRPTTTIETSDILVLAMHNEVNFYKERIFIPFIDIYPPTIGVIEYLFTRFYLF